MLKHHSLILFVISYIRATDSQLSVGDACTLSSTGLPGECILFSDCQKAIEELKHSKIYPQICGFQGINPIVCCEKQRQSSVAQRQPGVTSKKKCREYAVYGHESGFVLKNECGHRVVTLKIGSEPASKKEFPHMASVGYELIPGEIKWLCEGTIISDEFILTAGHCLISKDFGPAKYVRLGVTNLNDLSKRKQEIRIAERIPFKEYKASSHYHDIGLLRLEQPVKLNSHAIPACLNLNHQIPADKAIATGWGNVNVSSDVLLKLTLILFDQPYCNNSYKNEISRRLDRGIVDKIQMCAGFEDQEENTCQDGSGGPLQIFHLGDDVKCMYDIVGVKSFGRACTGSPGVYTRVSNYIQWIEDIVWPRNTCTGRSEDCESQRLPGAISNEKCREYTVYQYEKKRPPTLVIGGKRADKKEFSHMAVVGYELTLGDIQWLCGGTIISPNFILTAGHCLRSKDLGPAKYVRLGVTNLNETSAYRQDIRIAERIPYKDYKASSHYHDIALLKLERPADMTSFATPACLNLNYNISSEKAIATGWGDTAYGGVRSHDLLKVTLKLFDQPYCNNSYKNQISRRLDRGIVDEIQVCAGSETEEKNTCQGDSGGPLQIHHTGDDVKGMYDIIGVTSFGLACGETPGVYTRVSNYIQWIEGIVWP